MGSASEVDTLLIIAKDLNYVKTDLDVIEKQVNLVRKLLVGYKNISNLNYEYNGGMEEWKNGAMEKWNNSVID